MAARFLLRPGGAVRLAALGTAGLVLVPKSALHAEAPSEDDALLSPRKPIYDESHSLTPPTTSPSSPKTSPTRTTTPTDRLTSQIARARLLLHKYASKTEDATNALLDSTFSAEKSFTNTIASLAPPKTSGEKLMPGLIYVLVSAMGSQILVRNRNILLRASVPLAVGVGAGWYFIPVTMGNVGDLAWRYEERVPVVADAHLRVRERVKRFVETGMEHGRMGFGMLEEKVGETRESMEKWVSKGK